LNGVLFQVLTTLRGQSKRFLCLVSLSFSLRSPWRGVIIVYMKLKQMSIQTVECVNLTDIAIVIGEDIDDLAEKIGLDWFTWGDTDRALVALPKILGLLEEHEEEAVMEALWDIIGTDVKAAAKVFVDLAH
jgi:hypothetical protein